MKDLAGFHRRRFLASVGALAPLSLPVRSAARPVVPVLLPESANMAFLEPLLKLIADGGGFEWRPIYVPWPRVVVQMNQGDALAWGLARVHSQDTQLVYSDVVINAYLWLVVPAGRPQASPGLPGLKGQMLCKQRSASLGDRLDAERGKIFQVTESDLGYPSMLRMLQNGRCDGMLMTHRSQNPAVVEQRLATMAPPGSNFILQRPPLDHEGVYFAAAKSKPELAAQLALVNEGVRVQARAIQTLVDSNV